MRPHELLEEARAETGLADFGEDSFREGLERLVRALRGEAQLNAVGQGALRQLIVGLLAQRLQIEDWYRRQPEIGDELIERPLISLGLPRTGSTALSFLLAQDPDTRSLSTWEAMRPCPPPSTVSGSDSRIERAAEQQAQSSRRHRALVPATATGPDRPMTHRDPAEVVVSVADLYADTASRFSDGIDLRYLGALNVEHWSAGMQRALAFRNGDTDARFYDIDFRAMQRNPIGEIRGLYAWLGEPVTEAFEAGMHRWWQENAEQREQNVHPDPAAFGIDLDQVRLLFAGYTVHMARWTAS